MTRRHELEQQEDARRVGREGEEEDGGRMNGKLVVSPVPPAWSGGSSSSSSRKSSVGVRLEDSHGPHPKEGGREGGREVEAEEGREEGYDLTKTTTEVYGVRDGWEFYGPYAAIRHELDYAFHWNYQKGRQEVQDRIIKKFLEGGTEGRKREWGRESMRQGDPLLPLLHYQHQH
jgi:hypothetical protein